MKPQTAGLVRCFKGSAMLAVKAAAPIPNRYRRAILFTLAAGTLIAAPLLATAAEFGTGPRPLRLRTAGEDPGKRSAEGTMPNPVVLYERSFAPVMEGLDPEPGHNQMHGSDWLATASGYLRLSRLDESPLLFRAALDAPINKDDIALVHFGDLPMDAVRNALQRAGVTPLGEVPNNALVVTGVDELAAASLSRAGATLLAWTPGFFVVPTIGITPVISAARAANPILDMQASVFPGTDQDLVISRLEGMGASVQGAFNGLIFFSMDIDDLRTGLETLAGLPVRVLDERRLLVSVDEDTDSAMEIGRFRGGDRPYHEMDVNGSSQIIGITDTGLSVDAYVFSETTGIAGTPSVTHRKIVAYVEAQNVPGNVTGLGDLLTCDGATGATHGHLVASIAAANASDLVVDIRALSGFEPNIAGSASAHAVDGVAAGARVYFVDDQVAAECPSPDQIEAHQPGSLSANVTASQVAGARIHNFSFAEMGSESLYTVNSQDLDGFLANPANTGFLVVTAAGNSGIDADNDGRLDFATVTAPGTAKNALTVGSSGYPNNALDPTNSVEPYVTNNGIGMISRFAGGGNGSGQGPATYTTNSAGGEDWRIKPDIMAPGDETLGNQRLLSPTTCISSDNDQTGTPECSRLSPGIFKGTSFAAAAVSGAAAQVRDYFAKGFAPAGDTVGPLIDISGMELKAALIASADMMAGNPVWRNLGGELQLAFYSPRHLSTFTPEQGYGRVQLNKLLPLHTEPGTPSYIHTELVTLPLASTVTRAFNVVNADEELRCAVSWYDKESTLAAGGKLVRNVDLVVTECGASCGDAGDVAYLGNHFSEDADFDGTLQAGTEDCNGNGVLDFSEFSLPAVAAPTCLGGGVDENNSNEAIFLSPAQLGQGDVVWVELTWAGTSEGAPPPTIEAGLVCTGGIAGGGTPDSIRFNKSRYTCTDALDVTAISTAGSACGAVNGAVELSSMAADGFSLIDRENTLDFCPGTNPNLFTSNTMAVVDAAINPPVINDLILAVETGGHIVAAYGAASATATIRCTPQLAINNITRRGANAAFGIKGGCDPAGRIDPRAILKGVIPGAGTAVTGDLFLDANEDLKYQMAFTNLEEDGDLLDVRATLKACVAGSILADGSCAQAPAIDILDPEQRLGNMGPGKGQVVSFNVHVSGGAAFPEQIQMVFGVTAAKNGLTVASETTVHHVLNTDTWSFPDEDPAVSGVKHFSTDFHTGGREVRVYAGEFFDPLHPYLVAEEFIFQDMTTSAFGGGNASILGFNPVSGKFEDAIANNMPWTFDLDDERFGARRRFGSDPGDNLEIEVRNVWQWNNTGECGFQSNHTSQADWSKFSCSNNPDIPCDPSFFVPVIDCGSGMATCDLAEIRGAGGMWHTGHALSMAGTPGGRTGYDVGCEDYDLPGSLDPGRERVIDSLASPIFFRVHQDPDSNGFAYQVEFTRFAFNLQNDLGDGNTIAGYELDPDTTTAQPVDPLDFGWLASDQGITGFLSGISPSPYQVFNPNNPQDPTSATTIPIPLDDSGTATNNIRSIQGRGSPGSFFEIGNANKAPARSFGWVGTVFIGRGLGSYARRGAGGFPVRNYDNQLADGFAATFEDVFGPNETRHPDQVYPITAGNPEILVNRRDSYQANFTMVLREAVNPATPAIPSYGVGIDDVVVEWRESHPMEDRTPCSNPSTWALDENGNPVGGSTTCIGGINAGFSCSRDADCPGSECTAKLASGCAVISWDRSNILSAEDTLTLTVIDTNAQFGPCGFPSCAQAQDTDGNGFAELYVPVNSDADLVGEVMKLEQIALASPVYRGTIAVSATKGLTSAADNTLFIQETGDGSSPTAVNAYYSDQDINVAGAGLPDVPCPDNPLVATALTQFVGNDVTFVTAMIVDVGPNADNDLIADPGETIEMSLTLMNSTLDVQRQPQDLLDVKINLVANSNHVGPDRPIACILEGETYVGLMPAGLAVITSPLRWVVGDFNRTSVSQVLQAEFTLGIQGRYVSSLGIQHQVTSFRTPQSFGVNLDLDLIPGVDGKPLLADTACEGGTAAGVSCRPADVCADGPDKDVACVNDAGCTDSVCTTVNTIFACVSGGGTCVAMPAYLQTGGSSTLAGKVGYFEGFEGFTGTLNTTNPGGGVIPGTGFEHAPAIAATGGYLDSGGPLDVDSTAGGLAPGSSPGNTADVPQGSSAVDGTRCQYNDIQGPSKHGNSEQSCRPWDGSDWHVTDEKAFSGLHALYAGVTGISLGLPASYDTGHTNALFAAFSGTMHVGMAGGAALSVAQIVAGADDRTFNVPAGNAVGRGILEWVEVDGTGKPVNYWRKLKGYQNTYANIAAAPVFTNCIFDSYDDSYDTFAALGGTPGFDPGATSLVGVQYNLDNLSSEDDYFDPNDPLRQFGPSGGCYPEFVFSSLGDWTSSDRRDVGKAFTPGEPGSVGSGIWVKSLFNLDEAAGRSIRVRYVWSDISIGPGFLWADLFGDRLGNATRGWVLDDVAASGLLDSPTVLSPDPRPYPGVTDCPVDPDPLTPENEAACGTVNAIPPLSFSVPVAGSPVAVDAGNSWASSCVNGHLEYRWYAGGLLAQDWSTNPLLLDAPLLTTQYTVVVRCSTDPACFGTGQVVVEVLDGRTASDIPSLLMEALPVQALLPTTMYTAHEPTIGGCSAMNMVASDLHGDGGELRQASPLDRSGIALGTALRNDLCNLGSMAPMGGGQYSLTLPTTSGPGEIEGMLPGEIDGFLVVGTCQGIFGSLGRVKPTNPDQEVGRGRVDPAGLPACP